MAEEKFLVVRLSSLGDIVFALPAAAALRRAFPAAQIDWVVNACWRRLLDGNAGLSKIISLGAGRAGGLLPCGLMLRRERYSCAVDLQGLYRSALLAFISAAPRRVGFAPSHAREALASLFYTERVRPSSIHMVEQNLSLVGRLGAPTDSPRFPLTIRPEDDGALDRELARAAIDGYFVVVPGGGWRSKCWRAHRFGELSRRVAAETGWRGIVSYGPGEKEMAAQVVASAGDPAPVPLSLELGVLMALLRRARFVVAADTGPLHLAAALGTAVIGLYGPTSPARNGPYSQNAIVLRNATKSETTYKRGTSYSPAMLSISVDQVFQAVLALVRGAG